MNHAEPFSYFRFQILSLDELNLVGGPQRSQLTSERFPLQSRVWTNLNLVGGPQGSQTHFGYFIVRNRDSGILSTQILSMEIIIFRGWWITGFQAFRGVISGSFSEYWFLVALCSVVGLLLSISGELLGTPRMFTSPHPPPSHIA